MRKLRPGVRFLFPTCIATFSPALGATQEAAPGDPRETYRATVRPVLEQYCFDCHGPEVQKAGVRLDDLDPDFVDGLDAEEWHFALDMIEGAEMPPAKAPQWSDDERRTVTHWIRTSLELAKRANEGEVRPVLRRLTRAQYTNSLRDLLGLGIEFGSALPPDEKSKLGFTNNGATLHASPLHLDTYQEIARAALDEAIVTVERPDAVRYRVRFGRGIGVGLVAAHVGGYQSVPLSTDDFLIEILDAKGVAIEPADDDERKELNRIRQKIGVGLRGSSRDRFRVTDEGLVLYGAVPHREKAPGAWQGPSPNVKLEMQRVFPERGEIVMRVRASRGSMWTAREPVLVPLEDAQPRASYDAASGEVSASPDAVLRTALTSDQRKNVTNVGDALVPVDVTLESDSRVRVDIPREGFWQVDLIHPPRGADAMPTIRVTRGKQTLDLRPELSDEQLTLERVVTPVGAAYLRTGAQNLRLGGPFFTGYSHVVLTPLPDDHPLVADLDARVEREEIYFAERDPVLRVYAGTRTDDGMDYRNFGAARPVSGTDTSEYVFRERLENLPIPEPDSGDTEILSGYLLLGLWNDYLIKDRRSAGPPLLVESIEVEAPHYAAWPPPAHRAIFPESGADGEDAYAREIIASFLGRAFRRPQSAETIDRYHAFWRDSRPAFERFEDSIREVLVAALTSPRFLYLVEPHEPGESGGDAVPSIDEFALASRLSYFLWNSCPDQRLLELARNGELRANVGDEALRLLDDPRAVHFVEAFAHEWLRLDRLAQMAVDVDRFPDFTRFVKRDMREETIRFLHHALTHDLTLHALIDSDFAMLNQNLAEFYGVEGVVGPHFRPVEVTPEHGRGGLLAHGAFLTGHSDGVQPHPIKRAVWLKDKILGDPAPPPPPNVPDLDPEAPGFADLTLKEQLEKHRDSASCRDCHAGIDPFGVAFERYSATGRLEASRDGEVVDASTTLPDGTAVDGVAELKAWLIGQQLDSVNASLIEHLFGYALGRDVSFADEETLDGIASAGRDDGYRLRTIVRAICESDAFVR